MSRIRTIKPEFWTSEQVLSCSPMARLLFIGLWNFCDDQGIHPASYIRLKAEIFPCDYEIKDIKLWIGELITNSLVREYVAKDNNSYWIVTGWKKHQRIDRPTYRHPLPLSEIKIINEYSPNTHRELADTSTTDRLLLEDSSVTDRNGKEGNGKDKDIREAKASPVSDIEIIFSYWQKVMGHLRAKLDRKRESNIKHSLKLGYTVDEIKRAIDGCAKTPFNMGKNDSNRRYDDIGLILRDAEHIDRFIENGTQNLISNTEDIMAGVL